MFGLLTHRPRESVNLADFRKSYCGTCKAIGTIYGQKERLLLNNDVVFLSELLAAISNNESDFKDITVNKCFSLPKKTDRIPDFLVYTASANILLAGIKIRDNVEDNGLASGLWRLLAWMQRGRFKKAGHLLEKWGLNMQLVEYHVAAQCHRERTKQKVTDPASACRYYSEMTGMLTGEIFRQAAKTTGKPETAEDMFLIGKCYGEIVYLVDAVRDYEKDLKSGAFNPLLTGVTNPAACLPPEKAESAYQQILAALLIARTHLYHLPITEQKKQSFAERLAASVLGSINKSNNCTNTAACSSSGKAVCERFQQAFTRTRLAFEPEKNDQPRLAAAPFAWGLFSIMLLVLPCNANAGVSLPSAPGKCSNGWADGCFQCCGDSSCNTCCSFTSDRGC